MTFLNRKRIPDWRVSSAGRVRCFVCGAHGRDLDLIENRFGLALCPKCNTENRMIDGRLDRRLGVETQ